MLEAMLQSNAQPMLGANHATNVRTYATYVTKTPPENPRLSYPRKPVENQESDWAAGFEEYCASTEYRYSRARNTFGGYMWPCPHNEDQDLPEHDRRHERPMTVEEKLEEFRWLTEQGMSPELALEQLGGSLSALERAARRREWYDAARIIHSADTAEWHARWNLRRSA